MAEAIVTSNFPNPFAIPEVKNTAKYCKDFAAAFHAEAGNTTVTWGLTRNNQTFRRMDAYARGEQSTLQYKELMGLKKERGDPNVTGSFRNINFEILKVYPKIFNVLVNKMVNQPMQMTCKAIDPKGISDRRKEKARLLEFMVNKDAIAAFEKLTGLGLEKPVEEGEEVPANYQEIDRYLEMNPKDITCMEVLDFVKMTLEENDWEQQGKEIASDLVKYGYGGTRQYIDVDNKIKFRRLMIPRCITNKVVFPDFRDMTRFGEYLDITISELKRKTNGAWGESVYMSIANKLAGNRYGPQPEQYYNRDTFTYAYDNEKVTVLECLWLAVDTMVNMEYRNGSGNRRVKSMPSDYVPFRGDLTVNNGQGISDAEYALMNNGNKQILRTEVQNIYQCTWVVDTEWVYDFGLMKNMLRGANNWQQVVMPVTMISTDFISTTGLVERPLDDVQLNYLQYQSHISASRPPGIAIEKHALARLNKGKVKWDPKKALEQYAESGSMLYDGYDEHGNYLGYLPFKELQNGLSPGANDHFQMMLQFIELIRNMLGINQMTEGQTPPERLGKTVAELSFGATDNALSHLTQAFKTIYQRTASNLYFLLQNNVQRLNEEQITESLGSESYKYFTLGKELSLRDMGIVLKEGPDDAVREKISQIVNMMVTNQEIPGEDAIAIELEGNPYRQLVMIRKHRKEREDKKFQEQQELVAQQGEQNTQTGVAVEQEKQKSLEAQINAKMEEIQMLEMFKQEERNEQMTHELVMKANEFKQEDKVQDKTLEQQWMVELMRRQTELAKMRTELAKQKLANQKPLPKASTKK